VADGLRKDLMSNLISKFNLKKYVSDEVTESQRQTEQTFGYKWAKKDSYDSEQSNRRAKEWLVERYCEGDINKLEHWLGDSSKIILDAGCGAGFSGALFFGPYLSQHQYLGVDISTAYQVAEQRFKDLRLQGEFFQGDISSLTLPNESVDIIFSEGVLHHTDNTEQTFNHLCTKLKSGGYFMFYVYRKKSAIREFTDDYIRDQIAGLSDEKAWEALKPLTALGIELGKLNQKITLKDDIPFLGIEAGEYDLQRFFYWHVFKAFYRDDYNFDEMHHINFDWYRPTNCHRHTEQEVRQWCVNNQLDIQVENVQESGITIVAKKK
jgi:SAM-dependent methyltransferase